MKYCKKCDSLLPQEASACNNCFTLDPFDKFKKKDKRWCFIAIGLLSIALILMIIYVVQFPSGVINGS